jgi:5'-nucleotidase
MPATLDHQLIVALSSRALFDLEDENRVFEEQNDTAYMDLQLGRLDRPATPGGAFPLVKKLLAFNSDAECRQLPRSGRSGDRIERRVTDQSPVAGVT